MKVLLDISTLYSFTYILGYILFHSLLPQQAQQCQEGGQGGSGMGQVQTNVPLIISLCRDIWLYLNE